MQKNGRRRRQEKEGNETCLGPSPRQTRVGVCAHPAAYTTSSSVRGPLAKQEAKTRATANPDSLCQPRVRGALDLTIAFSCRCVKTAPRRPVLVRRCRPRTGLHRGYTTVQVIPGSRGSGF